jgi:hypothetical protein
VLVGSTPVAFPDWKWWSGGERKVNSFFDERGLSRNVESRERGYGFFFSLG